MADLLTFATAAARVAASYSANDIGRDVRQSDDGSIWKLTGIGPTAFLNVRPPTAMAEWIGTRFYAVDYDSGLDTNLGYSDVSMAAAGVVAIKTLEHLRAILPKFGNGQRLVVACKTRAAGATYRNIANTADDDLLFLDFYGYRYRLIRGTATDATAGSVAFANDAADRIFCGAHRVPGTNTPGYNPSGVPTAITFDCVLAGGGAPGLAAEPTLRGKRVRFDAATTTVALRNVCRVITANDTDTITVGPDLPAVPVASDVFYIEQSGFAANFASFSGADDNAADGTGLPTGLNVAGVRTTVTSGFEGFSSRCLNQGISHLFSMIDVTHAGTGAFNAADAPSLFALNLYVAEDGAFVTTGYGLRTVGSQSFTRVGFLFLAQTHALERKTISDCNVVQWGASCSAKRATALGGLDVNIGNLGSASERPLRMITGSPGVALIRLGSPNPYLGNGIQGTRIDGVTFEGSTTTLIELRGVNQALSLKDCTNGAVANTGIGFDCAVCFGATIAMVSGNTFSATAGKDVAMQGAHYVHADYVRADLTDNQRNWVSQGGNTIGPATVVTNDLAADIGQYKIVRATASGLVKAAKADTLANTSGIVGVTQGVMSAADIETAMIVTGGPTWVQFDAAPTAGAIAYLSKTTEGNATITVPPVSATEQKERLGRVLKVSGTLGFLGSFEPDILSVLADGLA